MTGPDGTAVKSQSYYEDFLSYMFLLGTCGERKQLRTSQRHSAVGHKWDDLANTVRASLQSLQNLNRFLHIPGMVTILQLSPSLAVVFLDFICTTFAPMARGLSCDFLRATCESSAEGQGYDLPHTPFTLRIRRPDHSGAPGEKGDHGPLIEFFSLRLYDIHSAPPIEKSEGFDTTTNSDAASSDVDAVAEAKAVQQHDGHLRDRQYEDNWYPPGWEGLSRSIVTFEAMVDVKVRLTHHERMLFEFAPLPVELELEWLVVRAPVRVWWHPTRKQIKVAFLRGHEMVRRLRTTMRVPNAQQSPSLCPMSDSICAPCLCLCVLELSTF